MTSTSEYIRKFSEKLLELIPYRFRDRFDVKEEMGTLERDFKETVNRKGMPEVSTGIDPLDKYCFGIPKNRLFILGARPKIGKTVFATNLFANVASQGYNSLMFSLEFTRQQVLQTILSRTARIDREKFERCEYLSEDESTRFQHAKQLLEALPFTIYDRKRDIESIVEICKKEKGKHPDLRLVVVDTLQTFKGYESYKNKTDIYSEIIRRLKEDVAKELGVCVVLSAQLKQEVDRRKSKKPKDLDDLVDCKGAGEFCDLAMLLYRPEYYWSDQKYKDWIEVIFAGPRFGKSNQSIVLGCDFRYADIFPKNYKS